MAVKSPNLMSTIVNLCKRRGFIFQSSEIYGGLNSCWDYGPLGVELKRNVKESWWRSMVTHRRNIVGLDSSILMHPKIWEASGHLSGFSDPLVDCKKCKERFRADHLESLEKCPKCSGELTDIRKFNLMFKTFMGPVEDNTSTVYLRPETAQGIFVNFLNVQQSARLKPPFGIAQIGKSFRNEITPGNFIYRTREFEQMEMEFFVPPEEDQKWYEYWSQARFQWYIDHGIKRENLRLRDHESDELAHYAKACVDVEFLFPFGWSELEGIANRTDYDLKQHSEFSGKSLAYFDEESKQHYFPYVIEPAAGADRTTLAFLVDAYDVEGEGKNKRTILRLHPSLSPIKAAVLPLVKRDGMPEMAEKIYDELLDDSIKSFYDHSSSIGRRYARQDEIGTPYCITVDSQSLEDQTVTLRERDSREQYRIAASSVSEILKQKMKDALK
ncbi:glycine--tRNA ligase [Chitinispirillales bacterium ANBcel5]|uniref:glycine--tRNA ligase n=1 Tax=Cellulosispirillum alkaliphilum TaxID=3039283 RepID=UPI002A57ED55|nr:glycine--tRNA ligase [Chitinispirillales bacterium ANBcel5]